MSDVKFKAGDRVVTTVPEDSYFYKATGTVTEAGAEGEWDFFVHLDVAIPAPSGFDFKDNEFGFRAEELELLA